MATPTHAVPRRSNVDGSGTGSPISDSDSRITPTLAATDSGVFISQIAFPVFVRVASNMKESVNGDVNASASKGPSGSSSWMGSSVISASSVSVQSSIVSGRYAIRSSPLIQILRDYVEALEKIAGLKTELSRVAGTGVARVPQTTLPTGSKRSGARKGWTKSSETFQG